MTKPVVISIGEVLWDLFPEGERFGGAPANFACHAAILGADVSLVSAVGDDDRGQDALKTLQKYGVDVSLIQSVADLPTGTVSVTLDRAGKPTFTIHEDSAWDCMQWNGDLAARVGSADAVYFGTLGQRSEMSRGTIRRCLETARAAGIERIVDINLRTPFYDDQRIRESIEMASVLKLSDDELPEIVSACGIARDSNRESQLERLRDAFQLNLVAMTCGAQGAILATPNGFVRQAGIPTQVVDTVGAGDSFTAAFLLGLLTGKPHHEMLSKACEVAAAVCAQSGAVPDRD